MKDVELEEATSLFAFALLKNLPDGDMKEEILSIIADFEFVGTCKSLVAVLLNCGDDDASVFLVRMGD